ncbi:MAG: SMI1/KNR4 family protein [Oscillospiraceae bacterium]|nr:SMI1/KNR4 family protein [Oscillospiraceae bacterium]
MLELFDHAAVNPPITEEQLTVLLRWLISSGFPDTTLSDDYTAFLRESNGGDFVKDGREFQFLSAEEVTEYYAAYNFARYMPYALPFAMDGNGNFYIFDRRKKDESVYLVSAGDLGWSGGECELYAESFADCFKISY